MNLITIGEHRINLDNVVSANWDEQGWVDVNYAVANKPDYENPLVNRRLYGEEAAAFLWWWDHKGTRDVLERYRRAKELGIAPGGTWAYVEGQEVRGEE